MAFLLFRYRGVVRSMNCNISNNMHARPLNANLVCLYVSHRNEGEAGLNRCNEIDHQSNGNTFPFTESRFGKFAPQTSGGGV